MINFMNDKNNWKNPSPLTSQYCHSPLSREANWLLFLFFRWRCSDHVCSGSWVRKSQSPRDHDINSLDLLDPGFGDFSRSRLYNRKARITHASYDVSVVTCHSVMQVSRVSSVANSSHALYFRHLRIKSLHEVDSSPHRSIRIQGHRGTDYCLF